MKRLLKCRFLKLPKVASGAWSAWICYCASALVYLMAIKQSLLLPLDHAGLEASLVLFAFGTYLFWATGLSAAVLIVRDSRALRLPKNLERALISELIMWAVLTTIVPVILMIARGGAPATVVVLMGSVLCFGACARIMPVAFLSFALVVYVCYFFLSPLSIFQFRGLAVLMILDFMLLLVGWHSARKIIAGETAAAPLGLSIIESRTAGIRRWPERPVSNLWRRIWYRPIRRDNGPSPIGAIAIALGPTFVQKGLFGPANLLIFVATSVLWFGAAIWFVPAAPGHAALRSLEGELSALSAAPVLIAVAFIVCYPLTTLAALWRRWQAPAQELALLALQPGPSGSTNNTFHVIVAATRHTLWLLYLAALNLGIVCALICGWQATVTIAATATGAALLFVCLTIALIADCLPRVSAALSSGVVILLVFAIFAVYLDWTVGTGFVARPWALAAICTIALAVVMTIGLGAYGLARLLRQPHPFLAHR